MAESKDEKIKNKSSGPSKIHWAHPKSKYDGFGRFRRNNIKNSYTQ